MVQKKFQGAYDTFLRGIKLAKEQLEGDQEVDKDIVDIITRYLIILISHKDEVGIVVE